jgi:hypothetical protein
MNLIIMILSSFFLISCGVESQRQLSSQSAVSGLSPKQTLLSTKWRELDLERQCLGENCDSYIFLVSFTETSMVQTGLDKITKKVLKQKIIPIYQMDNDSFVIAYDDTLTSYYISGKNLTACHQGGSCFDLILYQ